MSFSSDISIWSPQAGSIARIGPQCCFLGAGYDLAQANGCRDYESTGSRRTGFVHSLSLGNGRRPAIILAHNVWSGGALPVVVIVAGWILLIKGLIFLLLPSESSATYSEALRYSQLFYAYMSIALLFGVFVTLASFRSLGRTPEPCVD